MAYSRFYPELRQLQKRANQRIVRLEQMGVRSPAYDSIQGKLEVMGKQRKGTRGRRFSETGKATYQAYEHQMKILREFLNMSTSTQKGTADWLENVWQGARSSKKGLLLDEAGVTKEDWLEFWKNMPAKQKDRHLGSEVIVKMMRTYTYKNRELKDNEKMSAQEIAEAISAAKDVKKAYENLGINYKDVKEVNSLGGF